MDSFADIAMLGDASFGGRAGELQAAGQRASLVAELGSNYDSYHAGLVASQEVIGWPDIDDVPSDIAFQTAWEQMARSIRAESYLRCCVRALRDGTPLTPSGLIKDEPLVDQDGRLLPLPKSAR